MWLNPQGTEEVLKKLINVIFCTLRSKFFLRKPFFLFYHLNRILIHQVLPLYSLSFTSSIDMM